MAHITSADVIAIAPELASVAAGTFTALIADAYLEVVVANWPSEAKANRAAKYLVAHMASLTRRAGVGGAVQSQSVGGVSMTFATPVMMSLGSTSYGQEYTRLQRLSFGGPWVP